MKITDLWDEMMALERRVDDLFREFMGPRARLSFPALPEGLRRPFAPAIDVYEKNGQLVLRAELPGIDPTKDVSVVLEDGDVVIRGERTQTEKVEDEQYFRMETSYGAFERRVPAPEGTTDKDVKAEYRDGILEVRLPKAATAKVSAPKAKSIPIKTGKAA